MREVRTGVWHWEARHPDWTPEQSGSEGWGPEVSSYAVDDGERLLLFDPLAPPNEIDKLAAGRETVIVLTCPWHRRDAQSLAARIGVPLYLPPPDEGDPTPSPGTCSRPASGCRSGSRPFQGWSRTT